MSNLDMARCSSCLRRGATVAAVLWVLLGPATAAAGIQIETIPGVVDDVRLQLIRNQVGAVARRAPALSARVTIGVGAFQAAIDRDDGVAIVATYLTSTEFRAVMDRRAPSMAPITAVFSNPDPLDQFFLAQALLGPAKLAVFDSPAVHPLVMQLAERRVVPIPVEPNEGIDQLLRRTDSFSAIVVLPDLSVINRANIGHVVRTLYQEHQVLIGYSKTLVEVGSLASVYPSAEAIARDVKDALEKLADQHSLPPPIFVSDVEISLNERLARSLNIVLPDKTELLAMLRSRRETSP